MSTPVQGAQRRPRTSTQPLDAPQSLVGRVIDGRYRLERLVSAGGMGIVFAATQLSVPRAVAVKILRPTLARDAELVRRFEQEVELIASIRHPNIVALVDSGRDAGGLLYLVLEYVEGCTLSELLHRPGLTLVAMLEVFAQICAALVEVHGRGIVHRDLKLDNVMVSPTIDRRPHVRLLDFGVAKLLTRNEELTRQGQVAGTPGIIAPELLDQKSPTARSDLYSLGVMFFTLLVGKPPFEGANDLELMRAHRHEPLPNLRYLVGDAVPEEVLELVAELLEKNPAQRPESAQRVRDRLERIALNLRERLMDAPIYVPPLKPSLPAPNPDPGESWEGLVAARQSQRLIPGLDADGEALRPASQERSGVIGFFFREPVVAPATVVAALTAILIILVLIILYMFYTTFGRAPVS